MKMKHTLLTAVLAFGLMSCAKTPFHQDVEYGFALDWNEISFKSDEAKKEALRSEQFKLNLVRVTDLRTPEDRLPLDEDHVIYDYRPNNLLNGLESYVNTSINKYMRYSDKAPIQLNLEVNIKHFKTTIEHSFLQRYGQYRAAIALEFLVRDKDSRVLMREIVSEEKDVSRMSFKGQMPTAKRDRKYMKRMLKELMSELTLDMGWTVHSAFNEQRKYYHPLKEDVDWMAD